MRFHSYTAPPPHTTRNSSRLKEEVNKFSNWHIVKWYPWQQPLESDHVFLHVSSQGELLKSLRCFCSLNRPVLPLTAEHVATSARLLWGTHTHTHAAAATCVCQGPVPTQMLSVWNQVMFYDELKWEGLPVFNFWQVINCSGISRTARNATGRPSSRAVKLDIKGCLRFSSFCKQLTGEPAVVLTVMPSDTHQKTPHSPLLALLLASLSPPLSKTIWWFGFRSSTHSTNSFHLSFSKQVKVTPAFCATSCAVIYWETETPGPFSLFDYW